MHLLKDALAPGPVSVADLEDRAEQRGIRARQLKRARDALGVRVERRGGGVDVVYVLDAAAEA
jgi:hypothetical protein